MLSADQSAERAGAPTATDDLFAKCITPRLAEYRAANEAGLLPYFREMASQTGPTVLQGGQRVIMLGSNCYLGLSDDERVKKAAIQAVEQYGTGCTGSRLMNGTLPLHRELEEELVDWIGGEACLVFTTGYAANLGAISSLIGPGDTVVVDASSHASIIDGARLSTGTMRSFRHNSVTSLGRRLEQASQSGGTLVAIDSVYSMEGDVAPLAEIFATCRATGARLLVDEAHALGVLGPQGAGLAAGLGLDADLIMGTFSKSLASCGGFILGPLDVIDYLRTACRPFLFTAAGVPAALGAALAATRLAREDDWRREAVRERAAQLRTGLTELGYDVGGHPDSAIVPVHIGDDWKTVMLWQALLDGGVYTNCALAPAVPARRAMLRTSVMATHSRQHIDDALRAFEVARSALD